MSTHNKPIKLQNVDRIVATDGSVLNVSAVANGNINTSGSTGVVSTDLGITMDDTTYAGEFHYEFGGTASTSPSMPTATQAGQTLVWDTNTSSWVDSGLIIEEII